MTIAVYNGILIDYSRDDLLNEQSKIYWEEIYQQGDEKSPQEAIARFATAFCFGDYELAQGIYNDASLLDAMGASPVITNAPFIPWPRFGKDFKAATDWLQNVFLPSYEVKALPISCFLMTIPDSREGLVEASTEAKWLSMMGGGVGVHPLNRPVDGKSTGVMAHMKDYDNIARAYKQAETRRGSLAGFLSVDHPEILQFMDMRVPHGELSKRCLDLNNGVNITDAFMYAVRDGADWPLVNKHTGHVVDTVKARDIWERILDLRFEAGQGEPYLVFIDRLNEALPQAQKDLGLQVHGSNICTEITLATNAERTAVCCLSSGNLETFNDWKPGLVGRWIRFLDNVIEFFIHAAPDVLKRAKYSAYRERALGFGTMGWHSYLQKHDIAFESGGFGSAIQATNIIYKKIKQEAVEESRKLAVERGEAPDMVGTGMRNSHLLAIAPNASISSLVMVSPGIEPWKANVFVHKTRAGSFLIKNKWLEKKLKAIAAEKYLSVEEQGNWIEDQWEDMIRSEGSCQHLDYLSSEIRSNFKTAGEMSQMWLIEQAAHRQPHLCQTQSLNVFFRPGTTKQEFSDVHWAAWEKKLKTMYYCRTDKKAKGKKLSEQIVLDKLVREDIIEQEGVVVDDTDNCLGCGS